MKITVREQDKQIFCLNIPTGLIINRISAAILPTVVKRNGGELSSRQIWGLCCALREYRRSHPEWVLVEACTADGEYVKIEI